MSDPRLTAAQVRVFRGEAKKHGAMLHDERVALCDSHEAYRADVERLTAEHAALKTSDSQRVILEMLLSAIDTVLLGNEVSDFEESFPPVRQVIDLKDERDHLRAENAALREERDAAQKAMSYTSEQAHLEWTRAERLERELAEARAEIAKLTPCVRELYEALAYVWGNEEDCESCAAIEESPCELHGSTRLYNAARTVEEVLGPCRCGHHRMDHHTEDSTACMSCSACQAFRLPAPPAETKETR